MSTYIQKMGRGVRGNCIDFFNSFNFFFSYVPPPHLILALKKKNKKVLNKIYRYNFSHLTLRGSFKLQIFCASNNLFTNNWSIQSREGICILYNPPSLYCAQVLVKIRGAEKVVGRVYYRCVFSGYSMGRVDIFHYCLNSDLDATFPQINLSLP